jgi:hypothetical protein
MRRFIFEDLEYNVKVTLDMPEDMFNQFRDNVITETGFSFGTKEFEKQIRASIKELVIYTINKEQ